MATFIMRNISKRLRGFDAPTVVIFHELKMNSPELQLSNTRFGLNLLRCHRSINLLILVLDVFLRI